MPSSVRLERIKRAILRRASEVVTQELKDPRLGLVTLSKVDLTGDVRHATLYWSTLGDDADRRRTAHALESARGHVQSEVAAVLRTRVTPILRFELDESIEGVIEVSRIMNQLHAERAEREAAEDAEDAEAEETGEAGGDEDDAPDRRPTGGESAGAEEPGAASPDTERPDSGGLGGEATGDEEPGPSAPA